MKQKITNTINKRTVSDLKKSQENLLRNIKEILDYEKVQNNHNRINWAAYLTSRYYTKDEWTEIKTKSETITLAPQSIVKDTLKKLEPLLLEYFSTITEAEYAKDICNYYEQLSAQTEKLLETADEKKIMKFIEENELDEEDIDFMKDVAKGKHKDRGMER